MNQIRIDALVSEILRHFDKTEIGYCARVDFLSRQEALEVCKTIAREHNAGRTRFLILSTEHNPADSDTIFISTDQAIELRNRKLERLCLFIPSDSVDAAFSSLANSFAVIDGRKLHDSVLKRLKTLLPEHVRTSISEVLRQVRGSLTISKGQQIDFVCSAIERSERDEVEQIGLDLWRVGLITDARPDFVDFLPGNRRSVLRLAHPGKLQAMAHERVQELGVNRDTAKTLTRFFQNKTMQNVQEWSKELVDEHFTFDCWNFPQEDKSDIRSVSVTPFRDKDGKVQTYCKLEQIDGVGTGLVALCGKKKTLVVRWTSDPPQPKNLKHWRVEIVPRDNEREIEQFVDLPSREVPDNRKSVALNLDIDLEDALDFSLVVRVTPLDATGNGIIGPRNDEGEDRKEESIFGESNEFYLWPEQVDKPDLPPHETRVSVPTVTYGRLEEAIATRGDGLVEKEPHWSRKDLDYFTVRIGERRILNIGLSHVLKALEKKVIAASRSGAIFSLAVDDISVVEPDDFILRTMQFGQQDSWTPFWKAREIFFQRLRKAELRDVIEAADWTPELAGVAARYAQAYCDLIQILSHPSASRNELLEALSLDTILIRIKGNGGNVEEAIVTLPTHPLRTAWVAGYTQLLSKWEDHLFDLPAKERNKAIDMHALRLFAPTNIPAFAFHVASATSFVFFQNLRFFHGVHLPADVPDPHRRYGDIAIILGAELDQIPVGDIQPEKLCEHLKKFLDMHPYVDTLVTTLINPDRGEFFAEAIRMLLHRKPLEDEDVADIVTHEKMPLFDVISYVENERRSTVQALEQVRQAQREALYAGGTDYFLPGLTTTLRYVNQLCERDNPLPNAHIAIVTDFTRPDVTVIGQETKGLSDVQSFSFYGLVSRFVPQFMLEQDGFVWRYHIVADENTQIEPHPVRPLYSDVLVKIQTALLNAWGKLLSGNANTRPVLEIRLEAERQQLLERLHNNSNWVITLDRFFALDYYDSPNIPGLDAMARKYILDYSPEFADGLGHRMMVTTSWHEEIESLLQQAMQEQGFSTIEESVSRLLHYLKTVSGSLALQTLESTTNASAAVGLGVVTAWLQRKGRLAQSVLLPVDLHPRLFSRQGSGVADKGERRCDLVLISLKRNIVDATFIEVKWRRGQTSFKSLAEDMVLQMEGTEQVMRNRFFNNENRNENRVDGALQRSYLANVLRFYFDRSRRYQLFATDAEATFLEHLTKLEKNSLNFKTSYEGYIVNLEGDTVKPFFEREAKITVLTANDLTEFPMSSSYVQSSLENWSGADTKKLPSLAEVEPEEDGEDRGEEPEEINVVSFEGDQDSVIEEEILQHNEEVVVALGESARGVVEWKPSTKGSPHLFIVGIPGQGKSWTTIRLLSELAKQDIPSLVLDFHGQFADSQGHYVKETHPTVIDAANGLPFSPFECSLDGGLDNWKVNTYALAEIFGYVAELGDMQQDVLYQSIRDAYLEKGFDNATLLEMEYPTLEDVSSRIEKKEKERHVANVSARCRPLLEMDLFKPLPGNTDLLTQIRQGLVIDLHNLYVETQQLAAGAFVLRKLYKDMFHWGPTERIRLAIVLDEAHRLAKDVTLPKLMKEGRKFGIAVIVASQGVGDFHPDVLDMSGTKVIFRTNYPQSKKIAGFIRARPGQDIVSRIEQLAVGTAYVQTPDMPFGAEVHMYPLA
ncbi:MAG: ATP-binding protein [Ktedonobacteraceae bacterium]